MQVDTELDHEARAQALAELLDSWVNCGEEEAQEQRETLAFLKKALDEDRPSYRKLFSDD